MRSGSFPSSIAGSDVSVICQMDHTFQSFFQSQTISRGAQGLVIDHQGIQLIAFLKASYFAEKLSAAFRTQIESFRNRKEIFLLSGFQPFQLGQIHRFRHGAENADAVASGNVRAKSYLDSQIQHSADRGDPGGNISVRLGTVGDGDAPFFCQLQFMVRGIDVVSHHCFFIQQAKVIIHIPIIIILGIPLPNNGHLSKILRNVGVDVQIVFFR